jgi:hypothetical protein
LTGKIIQLLEKPIADNESAVVIGSGAFFLHFGPINRHNGGTFDW